MVNTVLRFLTGVYLAAGMVLLGLGIWIVTLLVMAWVLRWPLVALGVVWLGFQWVSA